MAFGEKQKIINHLEGELNECKAEVSDLSTRLGVAQHVGPIAARVEAEITRLENDGHMIEEAASLAEVAVMAEERERLVEDMASMLKETKHEEITAKFRATQGSAIRSQLDQVFTSDGTYQSIQKEAEGKVRAEIQHELLEEAKKRAEQEVGDEARRTAFKEDIRGEVLISDELVQYRQDVRGRYEEGWRDEAFEDAKTEIDGEEAARKQDFQKEWKESFLASDKGISQRNKIRERLEKDWKEKSATEIAAEIEHEELLQLLNERAAQETDQLRTKARIEQLRKQFEGQGVDMAQLAENDHVVLYLGKILEVTAKQNNGRGHMVEVQKQVVECQRWLRLTAIGEGRFVVNDDSLLTDKSVYARERAIEKGTVIVVGRKIKDNNEERLDSRIAGGSPLFYDDDTTTSHIVDARIPVANMSINGMKIYELDTQNV